MYVPPASKRLLVLVAGAVPAGRRVRRGAMGSGGQWLDEGCRYFIPGYVLLRPSLQVHAVTSASAECPTSRNG